MTEAMMADLEEGDVVVTKPASKFPTKLVVGGGIIAIIAFLFSRRGKGGFFDTGGGNRFTSDVVKLLAPGNSGHPVIDVRVLERGGGFGNFLFVKPGDVEGYTLDNLVGIVKGKVDGTNLDLLIRIPGDVLEGNVTTIKNRLLAERIPYSTNII